LITAQLVEAATGSSLWSDSYERELTSILALHGEVAQAISRQIKVTLTPGEQTLLTRTRQVNPEAYEACLKGMFHWNNLTKGGIDTSLGYFELAQEKDPDYALAQVGIAMVWCGKLHMGFVPPHEGRPMQRAAAEKAVQLDDSLAEAHHALGVMKTWVDWDWKAGETAFRRGIELNPNFATVRAYYSAFLRIMQRPDEAILQMEKALELDPLNNLFRAMYGGQLLTARRYDDAIEQFQYVRRTSPNHPFSLKGLIGAYYAKGMFQEALETALALAASRRDTDSVQAMESGYAEGGFSEAMRRWAKVRETSSSRAYVSRVALAEKYAWAGENQLALDWLERGFEEKDSNLVGLSQGTTYLTLHKEPRYQELLHRINFPEDVIARILTDTE
jgi:tetratricopeptide (TPR) repeat protein